MFSRSRRYKSVHQTGNVPDKIPAKWAIQSRLYESERELCVCNECNNKDQCNDEKIEGGGAGDNKNGAIGINHGGMAVTALLVMLGIGRINEPLFFDVGLWNLQKIMYSY